MMKRFGYALAIVLLLAVTVVVSGCQGQQAVAQSAPEPRDASAPIRTITVVGEGSVRIEPDMAQINIGVETTGASVKLATQEADEVVLKTMAALQEIGIAEKDMQTSGFSVWKDRGREPEMLSAEGGASSVSYVVNNTLNITIRDLEQISTVIDTAIDQGANNIHGVQFTIAEPEPLEAMARAKAIENALAKAGELAELTEVQVGQVLSVSEVIGGSGGYLDSNFMRMEAAKVGLGGGSITPGELELSVKLQVVYAIN